MNLHAIVRPLITSVNPNVTGLVAVSTGSTMGAGARQVPAYAFPFETPLQVQPLSRTDLKQLDALNVQGSERAVYAFGQFDGVVRPELKGGDLFRFDEKLWLVTAVIEPWSTVGWCKIGVKRQMDG